MSLRGKTFTDEEMNDEWREIQAAQVDPVHFRSLYDRYYHSIFRYIVNRMANEAIAADVCSQVFLKALQRIDRFKFRGVPFSAWLFRIASNEVAQYYRNTKKMRIISTEEHSLRDMAEEIDFEDNSALIKVMSKVVGSMAPIEIQMIEMRFFEQRPFKEIAEVLGMTESNAKVKTYRLLKKIQKKMTAMNAVPTKY